MPPRNHARRRPEPASTAPAWDKAPAVPLIDRADHPSGPDIARAAHGESVRGAPPPTVAPPRRANTSNANVVSRRPTSARSTSRSGPMLPYRAGQKRRMGVIDERQHIELHEHAVEVGEGHDRQAVEISRKNGCRAGHPRAVGLDRLEGLRRREEHLRRRLEGAWGHVRIRADVVLRAAAVPPDAVRVGNGPSHARPEVRADR